MNRTTIGQRRLRLLVGSAASNSPSRMQPRPFSTASLPTAGRYSNSPGFRTPSRSTVALPVSTTRSAWTWMGRVRSRPLAGHSVATKTSFSSARAEPTPSPAPARATRSWAPAVPTHSTAVPAPTRSKVAPVPTHSTAAAAPTRRATRMHRGRRRAWRHCRHAQRGSQHRRRRRRHL